MSRDEVFLKVIGGFLFLTGLFLVGTLISVWFVADKTVLLRMLTMLASMFTGILGFGSGYLLGMRRNGNGGKNGPN